MDNICSLLSFSFLSLSLSHGLPFALLSYFARFFPLPHLPLLSHSLSFAPVSTLAIFRQASLFGEGPSSVSDVGNDTRQRGVEWQGASHKSPPLKFCGPLAHVWPLSVALVSGLSLGVKKQPQCCITSPQSFGTWKFLRIFHCNVSRATLGIANSCLVGRPVQ